MKTRLERGKIMKKKKGFTLIELLAVIVILAIIALIAVPVVMNIISKANKSAFKDSAYGLLKAGENYYMDGLLGAEGMTEDKVFDFSNDTSDLEINGSKPTGGTMTVRKDGKISMAIHNEKHCVTKGFEDEDIQISDDVENCGLGSKVNTLTTLAKTYSFKSVQDEANATGTAKEVTVPACITNKTKCDAGTPVAVEVAPNLVYKFYVLNDDITKNEVTLIMDRNLYSSTDENNGNVAWINVEDYGSTVKNDKGPLTALKVLKERTSGWTNIPAYTYTLTNDDDGEGGSNTYESISKPAIATTEESVVENVRARLPRREELTTTELGCTTTSGSCKNWLYENLYNTGDNNTYGYWTSTARSTYSNHAWNVSYDGRMNSHYVSNDIDDGLRPVINLSK